MKNILLIGVGRFGRHIAMHLNQLGHQVMAVDRNEERIDAVMPYVTNAQIGDSVNADFLRSLGVGNYDVCIVTIGSSFQDSLDVLLGLQPAVRILPEPHHQPRRTRKRDHRRAASRHFFASAR